MAQAHKWQISRAIISFLCFLLALGVEIFIVDVQSLNNSDQTGMHTTDTVTALSGSMFTTLTLSIFQLVIFALVVAWSIAQVVVIHFEVSRCRAAAMAYTAV